MTNFEWDENKRDLNLKKHGIDFVRAICIFDVPDRIEFEIIRSNEVRYQTIGKVEDTTMLVVYTYRTDKKRIISARTASRNERAIYDTLRGDI